MEEIKEGDTESELFHTSKGHIVDKVALAEEKVKELAQLIHEKDGIIRSKEQTIGALYNSISWKITKPLRWVFQRIFPFFYFFFPYGSKRWTFIKKMVQTIHRILFKPQPIIVEPYLQIFETKTTVAPKVVIEKEENPKSNKQNSILFIGHDAMLAGAPVLLLSLIKWFSEHTGILLKVILLRDGVLLEEYKKCSPVLVWEDLITAFPDENTRNRKLVEYIGKVDLVYGNTVVVPGIYNELKFLNVPFITHVHELEDSINIYVNRDTLDKMHLYTDGYVAGSNPVSLNLAVNHHSDEKESVVINDFIEKREIDFSFSKKELRKNLGLIENGLIILGCGTIYWRKGIDLFIETALILKQKGYSDFHFYWIGDSIWDIDQSSKKICSWSDFEHKILDNGLKNHITFLGAKRKFFDYFLAGDIFYLSSWEDPFPLVALEAAQACMPIICFENAGGMPDFVQDDAGFVVPYKDVNKAVEKICYLNGNRSALSELGLSARNKFLGRHTIDIAAPEILEFCRKIANLTPAVSVIVPNYNCEKFISKRIDSILNQTFKDFEIIFLDDASTDHSLDTIEQYLHLPSVTIIESEVNSGSPFIQWHKGYSVAKGEFLWFAEADDFCDPDFLRKLLPFFNNSAVALAYSNSSIVDESGQVTGDYSSWLDNLDAHHWKSSYHVTGSEEINFGLGVKNSIPNASAVLIRKSCVSEAIFNTVFPFRYSGDWMFYIKIIEGNDIAYCSQKLNCQRKHSHTVSSGSMAEKATMQLLLKEQEIIHSDVLKSFQVDSGFYNKWKIHITDQSFINKDEFYNYYPYRLIEEKIFKAIGSKEQYKKLVFLTTNDGAHDGGSEQLWIQTAIESRKRGHDVIVIIKMWDPAPYFFKEFEDIGIKILSKEIEVFTQLIEFNPDLMIISTGDQDEGVEWYNQCILNNIDYVIINQLTKEPEYWPIRPEKTEPLKNGYLRARRVFFTSENNHRVMETRLDYKIPNSSLFFQPFFVDRNIQLPFPSMDDGIKMALPARILMVHKGQHLALEVLKMKKWRTRNVHLNFYGSGPDEDYLKGLVRKYELKNVNFHKPRWTLPLPDLFAIWRENHAILMPSFMEGMPLVLLNAMVCARVPIVTNVGGHAEIIENNINGFIAAKPTVQDLDDAMDRAYLRVKEWEEIGQGARQAVLNYLPEDPIDHFLNQIIPLA